MDYGKVIHERRKGLDINQEELAEMCGISSFRMGQIERGDIKKIYWDEIARIGKALHLNTVESWEIINNEIE